VRFQVPDRADVDAALRGICGEKFWLQVHEPYLVVAVVVDDDFAFEVFRQIQEYFLLAEVVGEEEDAVL